MRREWSKEGKLSIGGPCQAVATLGETFLTRMFSSRLWFHSNRLCCLGLRRTSTVPSPKTLSTNAGEDFGYYDVILPPEPYVWGVSHIIPRTVPPSILKPHYALGLDAKSGKTRGHSGAETLLPLGGDEERRIRCAASLAKKVLEYAGTLVRVCMSRVQISPRLIFGRTGRRYHKFHRRCHSRIYHLPFCLPVPSTLSRFPPIMLHKRQQHHCTRDSR
jgi:hypothetical protein